MSVRKLIDPESGELLEVEADALEKIEPVKRQVALNERTHLKCDSCYMATRNCPKYEKGADCSFTFDEIFTQFSPQDAVPLATMDVIKSQYKRVKRAEAFEEASGGLTDKTVSEEYKVFLQLVKEFKRMYDPKKSSKDDKPDNSGGMLAQILKDS